MTGAALLAVDNAQYVNVLCYHRFQEMDIKTVKSRASGDPYSVNIPDFEVQMQYLKDEGYTVVTMKKFLAWYDGKEVLPDKSVVITIDDGYESGYTKAYPVLKKYNYPFTMYIYNVFYPKAGSSLKKDEVQTMLKDGLVEFGSHSMTHPVLTKREKNNEQQYLKFLRYEIADSKAPLEKKLALTLDTLAYPYGAYSSDIEPFAQKAGFKAAFSVVSSFCTRDDGRFALKRTMIFSNTSMKHFREILEKKPLKIKVVSPADGDIIVERAPELKAVLEDDSMINTATIKFMMGSENVGAVYDAATKTLTHKYTRELPRGLHEVRVAATGPDGSYREYAWMFLIGTKADAKALKTELDGITPAKGEIDGKE